MFKNIFFCLLLISLVSSCDQSRVYEKYISIDKYIWDSKFIPQFDVNIIDTTQLYNIYINIRHADLYPYQNIWLLISTTFPDGSTASRRIEVMLANDEGKWYGEGLGDIWDFRSMIQENAYFNQVGIHQFKIEQNMRQDPLTGIMSLGIRVENTGITRNNESTPRK